MFMKCPQTLNKHKRTQTKVHMNINEVMMLMTLDHNKSIAYIYDCLPSNILLLLQEKE